MTETQLFVYGTLRHDQPEHRRFCRGVIAWRPARVRGRLMRIPEGYWLLLVPEPAVLERASVDAVSDEARRTAISKAAIERTEAAGEGEFWGWVDGEVLTFADAAAAWPPIDEWEGFSPGGDGIYLRCVVPVMVGNATVPAWAYVTPHAP